MALERFVYRNEPSVGYHYLDVDPLFLAEAVEHARRNDCRRIRIWDFNNRRFEKNFVPELDLTPLAGAAFIDALSINDEPTWRKIHGLSALESMHWLKELEFGQSVKMDLSGLASLQRLVLQTDDKVTGLNELPNLQKLYIRSTKHEDLHHIDRLTGLTELRLVLGSRLRSLEGIEKLTRLRKLQIAHLRVLTDLAPIDALPALATFSVERCPHLSRDYAWLKGNGTIRDLFIDEVQSLDFILGMPALEKLRFWNCIDGDLRPLPAKKGLQFYYPVQKRHYNIDALHESRNR